MSAAPANLDLLMNVSVGITAELGQCTMRIEEVLALGTGSIVELDRPAGAPIDVLINHKCVARGEIVAVADRYGVRLTELLGHGG